MEPGSGGRCVRDGDRSPALGRYGCFPGGAPGGVVTPHRQIPGERWLLEVLTVGVVTAQRAEGFQNLD